jgi:hypothetical protein
VNACQIEKANQGMPHQCHTTTLRSRRKVRNLDPLLFHDTRIMEYRFPSFIVHRFVVFFDVMD